MAEILNSSHLAVTMDNTTPVNNATGPWGVVSYPQGNVGNLLVYQRLVGEVSNVVTTGVYALNGALSGIRGTIQATIVLGATGSDHCIGYLPETLGATSNRIILAIDGLNRPYCMVQDSSGAVVAKVVPTWAAGAGAVAGQQITVQVSWDSTQAIDGTRFSFMMVGSNKAAGTDWMVSPTTAWTSFVPGYIVIGASSAGGGVPILSTFNGQLLTFQVSNIVVTDSSTGSFVSTRVLDRIILDVVSGATT